MLRVGLTGGIACGKSHVLARLAAGGLATLDLDRVAREVMAPGGSAYDEVVRGFGPRILDPEGNIDRKALGALVFADEAARARLNAIVHPRVRAEESRWLAARAGEPGAAAVIDAALLVESGGHLRFDRIMVVHCGPGEQLRRLMARDGVDEAAARARIEAQMPIADKRRFAHFEIDSSGSVDDTNRTTDALAATLRGLAASSAPRTDLSLARALGCLVHGPAVGPRGLTPARLLEEVAGQGVLEMERVARLLDPAPAGPWYRAARPDEAGPGPETLAGPVVLWALGRGAPDPPFLAGAVASLARLTHVDGGKVAGACLFALTLQDVAAVGRIPGDLAERVAGWSKLAERWGGAPASLDLTPVVAAALRHPTNAEHAGEACRLRGGNASLAAAMVGIAAGTAVSQAPPSLVAAVRALGPG